VHETHSLDGDIRKWYVWIRNCWF